MCGASKKSNKEFLCNGVVTLERSVGFRVVFCCICSVNNPTALTGRIKSFVELAMFTSPGQEKVLKPFSLHICGSLLFFSI